MNFLDLVFLFLGFGFGFIICSALTINKIAVLQSKLNELERK